LIAILEKIRLNFQANPATSAQTHFKKQASRQIAFEKIITVSFWFLARPSSGENDF
jgi:hypothetical protein